MENKVWVLLRFEESQVFMNEITGNGRKTWKLVVGYKV